MDTISKEDADHVKDHPFSSQELQALQATLKPRDDETDETIHLSASRDAASRDAIANLLFVLAGHPVATRLKSATRRRSAQLAALYVRLQYDDFALSLSIFDPLTTAVADYTSDLDIWKAVLQFIDLITPPPSKSIPASYFGTPFTRSSASHQGSDQSRADLKDPLRRELNDWTYENVSGFWEKYFEGKDWAERCTNIFQDLSKRHNGNALQEYPAKHSEDKIWEWLDGFQTEFLEPQKSLGSPQEKPHLDSSRGKYFRTKKTGEITGGQHKRQLDLLVKRRSVSTNKLHDWREVLVVGELTCSPKKDAWSDTFLQLAVYVREVLTVQPLRRFVHGFLLFGDEMQLWVFDRSGAYGSEFNVCEKPERFISAISAYALMSDEELGLDTFVQQDGRQATIVMENATSKEDMVLGLERWPFVVQRSIVSRGTACHRTTDEECVVKFSWRSAERRAESDLLKSARASAGIARLVCACDLTSIKELRSGLDFSSAKGARRKTFRLVDARTPDDTKQSFTGQPTQRENMTISGSKRRNDSSANRDERVSKRPRRSSRCQEVAPSDLDKSQAQFAKPQELFRNRILTCIVVSPAGRPLRHFRSPTEFLTGMRDAIRAHKALFMDSKILHRDISEHNIILTDPKKNSGFSGMLIDLDLAVAVGENRQNEQTEARHMAGTLQFMAIEILEGGLDSKTAGIEHTYRHDLESFFYVFLSICICYGWEAGEAPESNILSGWYTGKIKDIYRFKLGDMGPGGFEKIILPKFSPTFQCVIDLAMRLREILFSTGALDIGTREDPEELYGPMVGAFDNAIQALSW
ncbi:hypothetical protein K505DRAFT_329523 [Melanomma pulvis-pyrius CBS 109.77]|uniref:EKC/KEOPS complex subunit BUD32 n=1 Tax=Melanomma pulvis-pyrius CBS 109.77 TaxID=1314802 RepID=A0A6A6WUN6_9PLEO|nr:hypothetical protein K505DRAFT_329523 [Melanomma pulvis-pyrius CBS 109.77]